jgi:hypothetical protein
MALDGTNNVVYVSDLTTYSQINKYSLASPFTAATSPWPVNVAGGGITIQALCVDPFGNVYVAPDSASCSIYEYNSAGALVATLTQDATGPGIQVPTGLCTNSAGTTLYVSELNEGEILAYPISGGVVSNVTPQVVLSGVSHMYQISQYGGNYYLAEGPGPSWAEYSVGSGGLWSTVVASCTGASGFFGYGGIAVDSTGSVYVAYEPSPDEILKLGCAYTSTPTTTSTMTATNTATQTATNTLTNTATNTPVLTSTFTSTATSTKTATPSFTFTLTPSPTITVTATLTPSATITTTPTSLSVTPTSTSVPGGCVGSPIEGYTYPNPVLGSTMSLSCNLCEASNVMVTLYNVAGEKAATYNYSGSSGTNIFTVNINGFAYGIYYLTIQSTGPSGSRRSATKKFAITR